ncbi:hypothetical protein EJB05_33453, partial [Eragrostis curvula]
MGTHALEKTKKVRKAYTISRPREKWTADEHDRFVHALLIFGRDWKTIEQFVGTKTATQIRSHAQKYFLKAHKLGHTTALPSPHPRRAAVLAAAGVQQSASDWAGASLPVHDEKTVQLPLSPDDLRFAEVYAFIGDVFGSGAPRPVEAQLQRLHGADPVVAETILLVLRNLEDNLCAWDDKWHAF